MKICCTIVALLLLALSGTSLADYLIGKASAIEADTLEIPRPEDGFAKPDPALTAVGYAFRVRSRSYGGQVG
jgi:hypothetical protein